MFPIRRSVARNAISAWIATLAAFALALGASDAHAWIDDFTVAAGPSGTGFGTNCPYTVTITGTSLTTVTLTDDLGAVFNPPTVELANSTATALWTPTSPGTHHLAATDGFFDPVRKTFAVGHGTSTANGCVVD
ncbi:hypothetical protein [Nocardia concava]|uniref:hypothetical protein n=1 Tax=Nocardia concava TaxID=257281 RepID=UPI00031E4E9B|nr:hypothetical protein [Nocardia concava]